MKTGIIVQARTSSRRFPNKIFARLNGKPVIEHVLDELKKLNVPLVVAIPDTKPNDILSDWLENHDYKLFRGKENDVLARFYLCAKWYKFDNIIRVCADTPMIKIKDVCENLSKFLIEKRSRLIYGNGSWVFTFEMLKDAQLNQCFAESREHVVRSMMNCVDYPDDIMRLEYGNN